MLDEMDAGTQPDCILPSAPDGGCYPLELLFALKGCRLPVDTGALCFGAAEVIVDKHGHELDGDLDPLGSHGCDHRDTPEWQTEHAALAMKGDDMEPRSESSAEVHSDPALVPPTVASVGSVDHAIEQVKSLAGHDAGPGLLIAGAAALAVVTAAIKIVPNWLKGKQELEEKRLEIESQKAQQQDDQHGKCSAERAMLEAKVAALQQKLGEIEAKAEKAGAASMSLDGFDPDALEERLAKLEKATKAAAKAAKAEPKPAPKPEPKGKGKK